MGMGHPLEKESGEKRPATKQRPEEISLAGELRGMIDEILGESDSRSFDFTGREFYVINPNTAVVSLIEGNMIFGAVEGSLLDSWEWPTPGWNTTIAAVISKAEDKYTIEVRGVSNRGLCLTLDGNYPRIDNIVPDDSIEAREEEIRRDPNQNLFPDPVPSYSRGEVKIRARDGRLRPRIKRLEYGIFIVNRIKAADAGAKLLP